MQQVDLDIMQNWKKLIIMDPILNVLLDSNLNTEQFISNIISNKQPEEISLLFSKLGTFKHAIVKYMHKEVQRTSEKIIENFNNSNQVRFQLQNPSEKKKKLTQAKQSLTLYNTKYEFVNKKSKQLKNCYELLAFSKNIQNFIVRVRMLKNLNKAVEINKLRTSQIIKQITEICKIYDFSGIKIYQSERIYIKTLKQNLNKKNQAKFYELIQKGQSQELLESIKIAYNIGTLIDTIKSYFNKNLKEFMEEIKKLFFPETSIENELAFVSNFIVKKCLQMMELESMLIKNKYQNFLKSYSLNNLFEKYWNKFIQVIEASLRKIYEQLSKDSKWIQKISEINKKYPILFYQFSNVVNQIHSQLLTYDQFTYQFDQFKERFMSSLSLISNQYHNILNQTNKTLIKQIKQINLKSKSPINNIITNLLNFFQNTFSLIKCPPLFTVIINIIKQDITDLQNQIMREQNQDQKLLLQIILRYFKQQIKMIIINQKCSYILTLKDLESFQIDDTISESNITNKQQLLQLFDDPILSKIQKYFTKAQSNQ